jgi:hypothetical protein
MTQSEASQSHDAVQPDARDQNEPQPSQALHALRMNIAKIVGRYFLPLLIVTMLFALFLIFIIGTQQVTSDTTEKMALAASVQVAFGMVIGYVCVYVGLMMTWFGLEAAFSVTGSLSAQEAKGEVSLRSASPGLLFALGGMVLIAVCLYKPIEYKATVPITERDIPTTPPAGSKEQDSAGRKPQPLPPLQDRK